MSIKASEERTRNYLHQIKGAVVYKAAAMLASFMAIPLMIRYLGQEQYGIWSTLLTVMSWIVFFDLGVGNGLRNKVTEALARGNRKEAADYIGSGYSLIGLIAAALWVLVTGASFFINWQIVFNTRAISEASLRLTVQIAVFFILLNFWIGLIGAIFGALQKTSMTALGQLISNFLALLLVSFLLKTTEAEISYLALVYGMSLVAGNIILSLKFYLQHGELRPAPSLDKNHMTPLLSIGMKFFIIQVAVLVIFTTDKILITQLFGPEYVTQYDVIFKIFSVITFAHTLISAPLWSAYNDAYHRGDMTWIRNMLHRQQLIYAGVIVSVLIIGLLMQPIISIWIGRDMHVSSSLVMAVGASVLIAAWNNIYAMFVNGISEIKIQLYTAVVAMFLNVPLALIFVKYFGFGLSGIVMATVVSLSLSAVFLPIQVYRLMRLDMYAVAIPAR